MLIYKKIVQTKGNFPGEKNNLKNQCCYTQLDHLRKRLSKIDLVINSVETAACF